jgi:ketosteroid isomerase-like protein
VTNEDVLNSLDAPIRDAFEATNRGDSEGFVAAFAEDAVLNDWGRTFTGREEIARWNANENIGVQSHFEALAAMIEGDTTTVKIQVTGNGYNGGGAFVIASNGAHITRWDISG